MREYLIHMIANKLGLTSIPNTQEEFFKCFSQNDQLKDDLKKAENLGIIKHDNASGQYIIDMDKVEGVIKNYMTSLL